jgi:hypothetical protein
VNVYAAGEGRLEVIYAIVASNAEPGIDIAGPRDASAMQIVAAASAGPEIAVIRGKLPDGCVLSVCRSCQNHQSCQQQKRYSHFIAPVRNFSSILV